MTQLGIDAEFLNNIHFMKKKENKLTLNRSSALDELLFVYLYIQLYTYGHIYVYRMYNNTYDNTSHKNIRLNIIVIIFTCKWRSDL